MIQILMAMSEKIPCV